MGGGGVMGITVFLVLFPFCMLFKSSLLIRSNVSFSRKWELGLFFLVRAGQFGSKMTACDIFYHETLVKRLLRQER